MNERQKTEPDSGARDQEIRAELDQDWAASDTNDSETEHRIYREDAALDFRILIPSGPSVNRT